ncbi:hypothetical protein Tco_0547718 [Tanacetum coccineum]
MVCVFKHIPVFNQDTGVNSLQSLPQINHNCCYECGDSLDSIFCQRCTCKSCGKGAHYGYNCLPKASIISNPEQYNQTINELPQTLPSVHPTCNSEDENSFTYDSKSNFFDDSPNVFNPPPMYSCEFCGNDAHYGHYYQAAKDQYWKIPICYNDDDDEYSFATQEYLKKFSSAITPDLPKSDSLIMEDEHLDTILETESDELIKSSVEDLVHTPSKSDGISEEEVNDVDQEEKEFDLEDILQIQDVILREKLLNINRLIVYIESLNDNPSPDRMFKSPSLVPIPVTDIDSFFEEFDTSLSYSDKSLPEFEPFSDDTEETRSGSTTTHANNSLPEYIISFED